MMNLNDYQKMLRGQTCGYDDTPLDAEPIESYEHDDGWQVDGYAERQWLYVTCPKCEYQWSLAKLGIPRGQ